MPSSRMQSVMSSSDGGRRTADGGRPTGRRPPIIKKRTRHPMPPTTQPKHLSALIGDVPGVRLVHGGDRPVAGICYDSRVAAPDFLFVAVPGTHVDGHAYLAAAAARGATAALVREDRLTEAASVAPPELALLVAEDTRPALAHLAAAFYDHPGRKLRVVGVTGTDGKTT